MDLRLHLQTLAAAVMLGIGAGLVIFSGWGAASFDALLVSLQDSVLGDGVSIGLISAGVAILNFVVAYFLGFKFTLHVPIAILGTTLGLEVVFALGVENPSFIEASVLFISSYIFKVLSLAVLQHSRVGGGPVEAVILGVVNKFGQTELKTRLMYEATVLVIVFALSGPIGWGTFVATFIMPFSIAHTQKALVGSRVLVFGVRPQRRIRPVRAS